MANALNNHFVSIGLNLSANIQTNMNHTIDKNEDIIFFYFNEIMYKDVEELLGKLSPSKACGVDGISARLIKACGDAIVAPLVHIFNLSLQTSRFPDIWKVARVTALHKDGSTQIASNYRLPII